MRRLIYVQAYCLCQDDQTAKKRNLKSNFILIKCETKAGEEVIKYSERNDPR